MAWSKNWASFCVERVGRGLQLTPGGLELLDHVRVMGDAAGRVSMNALGQSQTLEGRVCISASETYAAVLLPPIIAKLRILEPDIHVEIVVSNQASDLPPPRSRYRNPQLSTD